MSYFMIVAVGFLAALILQFLMQMVQMKSFNQYYTKLRKMGRVAIGKAKGGFHAGAIVMFAIDQRCSQGLKTGISLMELMLERFGKKTAKRSEYLCAEQR